MSLLGKLDRAVYATGFDRIIFMKVQPRSFRWTPLLVLTALIVGYVVMAEAEMSHFPSAPFFVGWALFYGAYLVAAFLRIFGPRFSATEARPLDERELMIKARAYARSGILLTGFAMLGCAYMAIASAGVWGLWQPHTPNDWIALALGIQALAMLLPTWIASWLEPRAIAGDED
jgi:hypothetical protein